MFGVIILVFAPQMTVGQELVRHGEVVELQGEAVVVRLDGSYDVSEGSDGTVFAQQNIGGREQTVPVATIEVQTVVGDVVTGQVIERGGVVDLDVGFSVSFSDVQRSTAENASSRGVLRLASFPPDVQVRAQPIRATATGRTVQLEERTLGTTPLVDSLLPGRYRLTLERDGYRSLRRSVVVSSDSVTADSIRLKRPYGTVVVVAHPDSARISVDGEQMGQGRVEQAVDPGQHTVRVGAPGHRPQTETLSVKAEQTQTVETTLEPRQGTLAVTSQPDSAVVRIGDNKVGRTPVTVERSPGTYEVRVDAPQYEVYTATATVDGGEKSAIRADLQRPVEVELASSHGPAVQNARLERDGEWMIVRYDLQGDADEYDVTLKLSDERGPSFPTELKSVQGDVGDDVVPGSDHEIRWAVLQDFPYGLMGENFRLKIATDSGGGNAVLYVLGSALVGGGVTAAITLAGGEGGGGGGGEEGEIPTPPSPPD